MKYAKFEPWMIGHRIYWDGDGAFKYSTCGTVIGRRDYCDEGKLWALWDDDGLEKHIRLEEIIFPSIGNQACNFTNTQNMQEITINGKRYKLTLIED